MKPLARDLDDILERNAEDFAALRSARLFVTGGTGFVGSWLLESLVHANSRLGLGISAVVLTRDRAAFAAALPHVANDASLSFVAGDVRSLPRVDGSFDAIVHAATPASAKINDETPSLMFDTIVRGMQNVLEFAGRNGPVPFLLTSSGAVYGRQPPAMPLVDEAYAGGPDPLDPRNAYYEGKRVAELLCATANASSTVQAKVARLFAFVGPYLPMDRHFAIGNFVGDALAGRTIDVRGDGTAVRTYLYAADMTSWLWRILVRGEPARAYNVGSEETVDIAGAARTVARVAGNGAAYAIHGKADPAAPVERYACSTLRARTELDLDAWTPFEEAVRRTLAWHRAAAREHASWQKGRIAR